MAVRLFGGAGPSAKRRNGDNGPVPPSRRLHPAREEAPVTDQDPNDTEAPAPEPLADEPVRDVPPAAGAAPGPARGSEWMAQLEAMIQQISTQAAPVARQVGAKAAELAAVAAVKAGPAAQRAAVFTTDYGQRFAEKAQSVAAELRAQDVADGAAPEAAAPEAAEPGPATGAAPGPATEEPKDAAL